MPLRKSKVEYAELRARATGSKGHLGSETEAPSDPKTENATDAASKPEKAETPEVNSSKEEPVKAEPPAKKPAPKSVASKKPLAPEVKPLVKPQGSKQKQEVRPNVASKAGEGNYVRIVMHPIAAGLCREYDEIAEAMDIPTANKVILSRAIEAVTDVSQLPIDPKAKPYGRREGQKLETKRSVDPRLSEAVKAAYDPLNIMTEHTLAAKTAECLIANYIRLKG
ncbi:hypothetical protein PhaeoP83_04420 (plasmid) [Phaeobacter inhibens]|uniref:Uncharacterized protein n=2 Tax=Phaeobacter TaxID=302485 RepID=A0AAN1GVQ9_9RHOB|nr:MULTISPECIES: hypothetical protein [Phaeobacter]ATG46025.1 hypothetical protein PhaeoP13_04143 [Phaeobacter piscinae]AUQ52638.1 hypothetical protein PhaeoP83_04420 [Phaeobacter inhibens]AUQ56839.1 hypothetical protein PhaeoP92_04223 [Phaeobacter inhibens]AUQ68819.1 hypothetical protein PhaeoP78_04003 [Phaeobacter inhibens]AUQ80856.1 hypothetical protein PhaeoP74_04225 [Phaeobacter inhibens]